METTFYDKRKKVAREAMDSNQLDGILFTGLENIRYLCGFTGSDGAYILTQRESFFLTDSRYWTQSEKEVIGSQIVRYNKKLEGIAFHLADLKLKRIGFESLSLSFSLHQSLMKKITNGVDFLPLENELRNLRALKDDQELLSMKSAIDISSRAFEHILGMMKEGVIERDLALEMEFFMKKNGADAMGFDVILASGKRSALPHGKAGEKRIQRGDLILIDFGSRFDGYHSDQTRTVVCGNPSPDQKKIYQIVKEAHDRAIEKIRPRIPILEIDAAARNYIRDCGYDEYFGHGTGHGIGLAVHEEPVVNRDNKEPAQEGMVFTIEPGIYLPALGGIRIEDMVRVTSNGAEVLTTLPTELKAI